MPEFILDTSGEVFEDTHPILAACKRTKWRDLDAFTQGYIEALFFSTSFPPDDLDDYGFADLAPDALAAIMRDCAAFVGYAGSPALAGDIEAGRLFWAHRGDGRLTDGAQPDFPPLTAYLGDDGKVRFQ